MSRVEANRVSPAEFVGGGTPYAAGVAAGNALGIKAERERAAGVVRQLAGLLDRVERAAADAGIERPGLRFPQIDEFFRLAHDAVKGGWRPDQIAAQAGKYDLGSVGETNSNG